jgi:F0F1-type ATP synthase epsilon subunit
MTYSIDWRSAEVRGGTLSVSFNDDPDFAFLTAFDMVLIESGSQPSDRWGDVQIAGGRIVVADVQPGAGGDLRAFLDETVRQADLRDDAERERRARRAEEERASAERRDAEAKAAEASARSRDEQLEQEFRH